MAPLEILIAEEMASSAGTSGRVASNVGSPDWAACAWAVEVLQEETYAQKAVCGPTYYHCNGNNFSSIYKLKMHQ